MSDASRSSFRRRAAAVSLLPAIFIGILVDQITALMVDFPVWGRVSVAVVVVGGLVTMGIESGIAYPAGRGWSHPFTWWKHRKRRSRSEAERRRFRAIYPQVTVILGRWEDEGSLSWDAIASLAAILEEFDIWPPAIRRGVLRQVEEELKCLRKYTVVHDGLAMARERFPKPKTGTAPVPAAGD